MKTPAQSPQTVPNVKSYGFANPAGPGGTGTSGSYSGSDGFGWPLAGGGAPFSDPAAGSTGGAKPFPLSARYEEITGDLTYERNIRLVASTMIDPNPMMHQRNQP